MKQVITRPEPHGIGIDVGWRIFDNMGQSLDVWWGNTRDRHSLASLIADYRRHGYEFELSAEARAALDADDAAGEDGA